MSKEGINEKYTKTSITILSIFVDDLKNNDHNGFVFNNIIMIYN